MFPNCPGFEELSLRVEVQWQGRARPLVARFGRWYRPDEGAALFRQASRSDQEQGVLICTFEDDAEAGEWIVRENQRFAFFLLPYQGLRRFLHVGQVAPRAIYGSKWDDRSADELRALLREAAQNNGGRWELARIFYLNEVPARPAQPHIVCHALQTNDVFWCPTANPLDFTPVELSDSPSLGLSENATQARAQLVKAWHDKFSDAPFVAQWEALTEEGKFVRLVGCSKQSDAFARVEGEMRRLMRWYLISVKMWGPDDESHLLFILGCKSHIGYQDGGYEKNDQDLYLLNRIMFKALLPRFRFDWYGGHRCVDEFWPFHAPCVSVSVPQQPSAPEQLEAESQLRDWLQNKATPAQIKELLGF